MRALLKLFVLATVTTAWTAGSSPEAKRRAHPATAEHSRGVRLSRTPGSDGQAGVAGQPLAAPAACGCPDVQIPLEVVAVDGETGHVLDALARGERYAGSVAEVSASVPVPDGYVADSFGQTRAQGYVSRRAERARVLVPLRREAEVHVQVLDAMARPVSGARVTGVRMGGAEPTIWDWAPGEDVELAPPPPGDEPEIPEEEIFEIPMPDERGDGAAVPFRSDPTRRDGWTRVRGIPALLEEQYWIVAAHGLSETFTGLNIGALRERHVLEVRLPPRATSVGSPECWGRAFG
jgi:hypothetical protein